LNEARQWNDAEEEHDVRQKNNASVNSGFAKQLQNTVNQQVMFEAWGSRTREHYVRTLHHTINQ
jgi:hypothetical protein